ncbi:MAG: ribosomal protein S18 acetylase RimI-like enzyme [Parasphingorhabdus sp.]|jgi:ribosomal protein S18 acetylase RimI-like enzyme
MTEQTNSIIIRSACNDDAQRITQFNCSMALETEQLELDTVTVLDGVKAVMIEPSHGFYLIAESEGSAIGCLMITYEWSDWRNGRIWWIQSVFVQPEFRGLGAYKALYKEVVTKARSNSDEIRAIRLYVEKDNTKAQSVYQKLGMENSNYLVFEEALTTD